MEGPAPKKTKAPSMADVNSAVDKAADAHVAKPPVGGVITTGYKRDTNKTDAVTVNGLSPLEMPYPNFTKYQPEIGAFAQRNPENMAAMLIFVIATIGNAWADVVGLFPGLIDWIRRPTDLDGNRKSGVSPYPKGVPWAMLAMGKKDSMDAVWAHKEQIYTAIMQSIADDVDKTGFPVYLKMLSIPGLGLPKAGFATQLAIGKFGCIDSVNTRVSGAPADLAKKSADGKVAWKGMGSFLRVDGKKSASVLDRITHGKYNATGTSGAERYVRFLDKLKRDASDDASRQLWDDWCHLVAHRIWYSGKLSNATILANFGNRDTQDHARVDTYQDKDGPSGERLAAAQRSLRQHGAQNPTDAGHIIGRQHMDMIKSSLEPVDVVNALLESETITLYYAVEEEAGHDIEHQGLDKPYLAATPEKAAEIAREGDNRVVVLSVEVDPATLVADSASLGSGAKADEPSDYRHSLRKGGTCLCTARVDARNISIHSYVG